VPHSRIRELAEIAMAMDGVLKLYFGESNQPTPDFIKQAAIQALKGGLHLPEQVRVCGAEPSKQLPEGAVCDRHRVRPLESQQLG